jgi:transposase
MLELLVEHQAGIPLLMKPLSGNSSASKVFGQVVSDHIAQLQTTYSPTYLVADSALYNTDNLQKLADTGYVRDAHEKVSQAVSSLKTMCCGFWFLQQSLLKSVVS